MREIIEECPANNEELRQGIYEGGIYLLDATAASLRLVERAKEVVGEVSGEGGSHFEQVGRMRKRIFGEEVFRESIRELMVERGFDEEEMVYEPIRIRAIAHEGHKVEAAAPVYYAHRDTWYAHPQSLITWWIPLDDLEEEETFVFYPERFSRAVPNDSETFDYRDWVKDGQDLRIGWQDEDASKKESYPGVIGEVDGGREVGFFCRKGQHLLFSGSHFHRTRKHAAGRTRFSLDFRIVHLGDKSVGRGAPNVDNRSRGSALVDYERF